MQTIVLDDFEHIEYIECTYSQRGVHSLKFKTNTVRFLKAEGSAGSGSLKREIKLR